MATVYISEFSGLAATAQSDSIAAVAVPPIAEQTVAVGATSVQSAAFQPSTQWVLISSDSIFSANFGANPTATTANYRHAIGAEYLRKVTPGQKVAIILNT